MELPVEFVGQMSLHWKYSFKGNRLKDCQYVHDEVLYISSCRDGISVKLIYQHFFKYRLLVSVKVRTDKTSALRYRLWPNIGYFYTRQLGGNDMECSLEQFMNSMIQYVREKQVHWRKFISWWDNCFGIAGIDTLNKCIIVPAWNTGYESCAAKMHLFNQSIHRAH